MHRVMFKPYLLATCIILSTACANVANGADSAENFTAPKLPPEWKPSLAAGSGGSVAPSTDGLLILSEKSSHAFVTHDNNITGSDDHPLVVSAFVRGQEGPQGYFCPGIHIHWDNDNYCSIKVSDGRHCVCDWMSGGVAGQEIFHYILRQTSPATHPPSQEGFVRLAVLSHSVVFYASMDGARWYRLLDVERKVAAAPAKIMLGRAWPGAGDNAAAPGMANDGGYKEKKLFSALVRNVTITDAPLLNANPALELPKQDTWEQTIAAVDPAGIPRKWSLLGPLAAEDKQERQANKQYPPDLTDDWSAPLKLPGGQAIKVPDPAVWSRPDDDNDSLVDLPEIMNHPQGLVWAKTEVNWPLDGEALLWFDAADPIVIYVNGVEAVAEHDRPYWRSHALKDRRCVSVPLRKGANTIKVRSTQIANPGEKHQLAGFYLRLERNDPEFRIALLEKLLELFPDSSAAPDARLELPRRYEELLEFRRALDACDRAIAASAQNEDIRLQAFDTKLRILETLRDREGMIRAADAFLALKPGTPAALRAIRAGIRGEVLSGKAEAAQARVKKFLAAATPNSDNAAYILRSLAGAFKEAGVADQQLKALDALAASPAISPEDRRHAAIEAAIARGLGGYWRSLLKASSSDPNAADQLKQGDDTAASIQFLQTSLRELYAGAEFAAKDRLVWSLTNRLFEALASEGRMRAADNVLRDAISRYPMILEPFYAGLLARAALRRDLGQSQPALPFFERALRDNYNSAAMRQPALDGYEWVRDYRPERLLFETSNDVVGTLDAVRRQLAAAGPGDVERAMRNVADTLQTSAGALVRLDNSLFYSRLVGAREYVRALLAGLPDEARGVYRNCVSSASASRLKAAIERNDPGALESVADSFYYTLAAQAARNQAGNLYLDRGQCAQAVSMYQALLREPPIEGGPPPGLLLAKLAEALHRDGFAAGAARTLERLKSEFADAPLTFAGEKIKGADLAERLRQRFSQLNAKKPDASTNVNAVAAMHLGNLRRTGNSSGPAPEPGGVAWMRRSIPSSVPSGSLSIDMADTLAHHQSYPVCDGNLLFVSALDSLRALDVETGRGAWSKSWGSGGSALRGPFTGFPLSCPTVQNGQIFMRALESRISTIRCYTASSGKLRWTTEAVPALKNVVWLSDPALAYNMAFAVFLERGDMNQHGLAALDAETGRLRWKTFLVTGNTGVHYKANNYLSTVHLGPPAIDGGEVFISTGMSTAAAVNAFSGEVKWMTSYPKLNFSDVRDGNTNASGAYDSRVRVASTFCSGPLSPLIAGETVIVAPKDGPGILAFDRQSGRIKWRDEIVNARFIAGACDENVLICEDNLMALNVETGALAWESQLNGQGVYSQPALSGGVVYVPTDKDLQRIDAHSGALLGATAWDERLGPLGNLLVIAKGVIGIGENCIAGLGPKGTQPVKLPMYEARELVRSGKLEQAAGIYGAIVTGTSENDTDARLEALSEQLRILQSLGKKDAALQSLAAFEKAAPDYISTPGGLWQVKKEVLCAGLRARLGETVDETVPPPPMMGMSGVIGPAWQIASENPRIYRPEQGRQDRIIVRAGDSLECLRLSARRELIWKTYIGSEGMALEDNGHALAVQIGQRLLTIDRGTGQLLANIEMPATGEKRGNRRVKAGPLAQFTIDDERVLASNGSAIFAWDIRTGAEAWRHELRAQKSLELEAGGGRAVLICKAGEDAQALVYDSNSGALLKSFSLGKQGEEIFVQFSPDHTHVAMRGNEALLCFDLKKIELAWKRPLVKLDSLFADPVANQAITHGPVRFEGDAVIYSGWSSKDRNGPYVLHRFDAATGKELHPVLSKCYSVRVGDEYFCSYGDHLARESAPGKEVWKTPLSESAAAGALQSILVSADQVHLLYVRTGNVFFLRSVDWKTGDIVAEQNLPGTPIQTAYWQFESNTIQYGNVIAYTAREGIFAFAAQGATPTDAAEKLRAELGAAALPAENIIDLRRALCSYDRPAHQALLAPANVRLDSDPATWGAGEPITLLGPLDYVPLLPAENGKWGGANDLSATLLPAWNRDGIVLAVEVQDDVLVSPQPGLEGSSGDFVRFIVASQADGQTWLEKNDMFQATLAWVNGQSVLNCEFGDLSATDVKPRGHVSRLPSGKGFYCRYELFVPWGLIRKDPAQRPGKEPHIGVGVAVYDDDGNGVKGALELGTGVTSPCVSPQMLARIELLDISLEKLERYRKVIALMPDSDEAFRFLELLLSAKSGPKADADCIQELEGFVRAHPNSPNAIPAAGRLRWFYARTKDPAPQGRLDAFLKEAKVPAAAQQTVNGEELRMWVYPDPKQPPQEIILYFRCPNRGWCAGPYWGANRGTWGKDNTHERLYMGPLPPPGTWTELRMPASLFNVHEQPIHTLCFSNIEGQVYYGPVSAWANGKEVFAMSGKFPDKSKVNRFPARFVDEPKHDGAKSFTFDRNRPQETTVEPELAMVDGSNLFTFVTGSAPAQVAAAPTQEALRKAAWLIPDTADGVRLLQQEIQLFPDPKTSVEKSIEELQAFLKGNSGGPNDLEILRQLNTLYLKSLNTSEAQAKCAELMTELKLARDVKRAFFTGIAPVWSEWNVIGPFMASGDRRGMDNVLDPEKGVNLAWTAAGDGAARKTIAWQKISNKVLKNGKPNADPAVDLHRFFVMQQKPPESGYFGYAYSKFNVPTRRSAMIFFGGQESISIWVNGKPVIQDRETALRQDNDAQQVELRAGENEILIKAGALHDKLEFIFRLADLDGRPFSDVKNE